MTTLEYAILTALLAAGLLTVAPTIQTKLSQGWGRQQIHINNLWTPPKPCRETHTC